MASPTYIYLLWPVLIVGFFARSSSADLICGSIGNHDPATNSFYMGNFFYKAPSIFTICSDFCKADNPRCKGFRYSGDGEGQYCEFFDESLDTLFIPDEEDIYLYYDIDCPLPTFAITTTVSASATETATTTTTETATTTTDNCATTQKTVISTVLQSVTSTKSATLTLTRTQTSTKTTSTTIKAISTITIAKPTTTTIRATSTLTKTTKLWC